MPTFLASYGVSLLQQNLSVAFATDVLRYGACEVCGGGIEVGA